MLTGDVGGYGAVKAGIADMSYTSLPRDTGDVPASSCIIDGSREKVTPLRGERHCQNEISRNNCLEHYIAIRGCQICQRTKMNIKKIYEKIKCHKRYAMIYVADTGGIPLVALY